MKVTITLLATLLSTAAFATTTEQRQHYMEEMNLVNFMTPGETASYYWQNLAEVMPSAVVARAGGIKPLERNMKSNITNITVKGQKLADMLLPDDAPLEALMVIEKGIVTYEHFNIDPKQKHVWMSNAKTVAGLLVAMLEEEGRIDVQQSLGKYIPEVKGTAWENIKVIDVLNQQTGLDLEESDATRYNPEHYVSQFFQSEVIGEDYLENLLKVPAIKEPGQVFEYSSLNTQMLGLLINSVTNKRLSEVFEERIWSKAGMTGDGILAISPTGYEIIHGILSSNLEDMMRYGLLHTPSWNKTAEQQVISDQVLNTIRTSMTPDVFNKGASFNRFVAMTGEEPVGSSYQWDQIWQDGDMYKSGMRGQGIYISPDKDLVIGWFSERDAKINAVAFARQYAKLR